MYKLGRQGLQSIGAVPYYGDGMTYKTIFGGLLVWEGDGWKRESMSWKEGCYVASNLTGPPETNLRGPDAQELLSRVSMNNVYKWPIGKSKHLVMCDEGGNIATHGLAVRDGAEAFRLYTLSWPAYKAEALNLDVQFSYRSIFVLQIAGPTSLQVLERAAGQSLRDLDFLAFREIRLGGVDAEIAMEVSRVGMTGGLAYELRGPYELGPTVYDAVYQAGKDLGIVRLGWRTYFVNHTEGGFPQFNCSFTASVLGDTGFMNSPFGANLFGQCTGSIDGKNMAARFRTPHEVGWSWMAKFDHDFIGRDAVQAELNHPKRTIVTLRWNSEDAVDIFASHFLPGEEYQMLEFPCAPQQPAGGHADLVTKDGSAVGVASAVVYSYYYRAMLSQCTLDIGQATIGNEVIVHWGEFGKRIKQVRATVERFPYLALPRNQNYDLSSVPSGLAGV